VATLNASPKINNNNKIQL